MRFASDEELIFRTRPHVVVLAPAVAWLLLDAALAGVGLALLGPGPQRVIMWGVLGVVLLFGVARPLVRWATTVVTLTDRRLVVTTGAIRRDSRVMLLGRIVETVVRRSGWERIIGAGTLVMWTSEGHYLNVRNLPRAKWIAEAVDELAAESRDPGDPLAGHL
ncbi:hypothetical protein HMPREF1531_01715 [Propionibacterium sp. oral taxon 192 str. F0372]|uniref:PH domain-containing protein n=1 Tax=Propionibacterium sp. oral taxon 192 TaxID=671222 RepID=UPI0003530D0F|nr:PH domain-containing protein [Propionibacterium sp. oral taxon 192]EPH02409.1 hypothetical protein HMPREF1531_01715 [Propionibacterium sp. oral taxon 192 str. F0372]